MGARALAAGRPIPAQLDAERCDVAIFDRHCSGGSAAFVSFPTKEEKEKESGTKMIISAEEEEDGKVAIVSTRRRWWRRVCGKWRLAESQRPREERSLG